MQIVQIATLATSAAGFVAVVVAWLWKKNPQVIQTVVQDAEAVVHAVEPLVTHTPAEPVVNLLDEALKAASTAANYAEQLYKNDSTVDRKALATQYAANLFHLLKINITPEVAFVLDGAIEGAVLGIPSREKPAPVVTHVEPPKEAVEAQEGGQTDDAQVPTA